MGDVFTLNFGGTGSSASSDCRNGGWMLSYALSLWIALTPVPASAGEKKVLIRSEPPGAKVALVGGGMICRAVSREGFDDVTPCTFSISDSAFDPTGRYWERSAILGVPLKISLSKDGFRATEIFLTEEESRTWKGRDVAGKIEKKYFFVKQRKFEVKLTELPDYPKATSALLKDRPPESLKDVTARDALADCKRFYEQNNPEKAIQACNLALGLSGDHPEPDAYHYRCMSNYLLHNYQTALTDCQELTRLRPASDNGWDNAGLILQTLGRQAEAIANFDKALMLNASNIKALRNRAVSYDRLNRTQEALNDCDTALKLAPGNAEILRLRERILNRTKTVR